MDFLNSYLWLLGLEIIGISALILLIIMQFKQRTRPPQDPGEIPQEAREEEASDETQSPPEG